MSIEGFIMSHILYCRCDHVVAITEYLNSNRLHYRYISKIKKKLQVAWIGTGRQSAGDLTDNVAAMHHPRKKKSRCG